METEIIHEKKYQQFTAVLGDEEAELAYALPAAGVLDFTHTYVPESARGKGIATKLIEAGLHYARQNGYKVQASCPVVKKYLQAHPEQQ
ncbi:N-acetyltransferase [Pontibacter sp. 172403-2]|uniref:GNAT family N-acetyltransferase n=1 Tax=Pontibacter rufus TaxID=2791028 RepID=UPI0018AF8121|nr:GNAT family N-acetyltransferase [Pontibacter sp. 172403-2]MBF9252729.1 N-acetyltransferase [Pontibacter sp. 172403-2]